MEDLTLQQYANLRLRVSPQDRDRLRPDGLLEAGLPPMTACGGLLAPYLVGEAVPPACGESDGLSLSAPDCVTPRARW